MSYTFSSNYSFLAKNIPEEIDKRKNHISLRVGKFSRFENFNFPTRREIPYASVQLFWQIHYHSEVCPLPSVALILIDFWSPSPPSLPTHHPSQHTQGLDLTWTQQADHHQTRCNASSRNISIFRRKKKTGYSDWKNQEEDRTRHTVAQIHLKVAKIIIFAKLQLAS